MSTDAKRSAQADRAALETARSIISAAISFMQQSNATTSASSEDSTSFKAALQDAVFEIDSQPDIIDPYLDPEIDNAAEGQAFNLGSVQFPRYQGKLQRLRTLKVAMFGGDVTVLDSDGVATTETVEGVLEVLKSVAGVVDEEQTP